MNNTPDYENNLAFKPELTWEELCEYIKNKGKFIEFDNAIRVGFRAGSLIFYQNGKIKDGEGYKLAENRIYEQMKTIIEALWG